jgi:hypothetical protein
LQYGQLGTCLLGDLLEYPDWDVISAGMVERGERTFGPLKHGQSLLLEELDFGMLDFVLRHHVRLTFSDGGQAQGSFRIDKAYSLRPERYRFSKALRREAFLFEMSGTRHE